MYKADKSAHALIRVVGGSCPSVSMSANGWGHCQTLAETDYRLLLTKYDANNVEGVLFNTNTGETIATVTGTDEDAVYAIIWHNYFDQLCPGVNGAWTIQRMDLLKHSKELVVVFFTNGDGIFREDGRFMFVSTKTAIGEFLRRAYEDEIVPFFEAERQSTGLIKVTGFNTDFQSTFAEYELREVLTEWLMTTPSAKVSV